MQDALDKAHQLSRDGQFAEAKSLYESIITSDPENATALHSLGHVLSQLGDHAQAAVLIRRAISIRPSAPAFHVNLAEAYRNLGDFRRCASSCRIALNLWPDFADASNTLGLAYYGQGEFFEAATQFRRAIEVKPDFASAYNNLGLSLQGLERAEEAIDAFSKALELAPDLNRARVNLGLELMDLGRLPEALEHLTDAARRNPERAVLQVNVGNVLKRLDRPIEARGAYLEALQIDHELPLPHLYIGQTLMQAGQLNEALPWYRLATSLQPDNAFLWEQLAELYGEREEPTDAIPCWERALSVATKERAGPHLGLGWALQEDGRLSEAKEHYLAAARLQPELAQAQLSLGGIHEEMGEMAEAEAAFREALRLQPNFALPLGRIATLLRDKLPDADLHALESRLDDPELAEGPRTRLLFGLAHVLDARKEYIRVGDTLRIANSLAIVTTKKSKPYSQAEHSRFIDGLIRAFQPDLFAKLAGEGDPTRRPVFVFGFPRSGTTLVEQILASHPNIYGAGERRFARQSFDGVSGLPGRSGTTLDNIATLAPAEIRMLADRHLAKLHALDEGKAERLVDKMPDNYMYIGLLKLIFPSALFIHCRRDLRDVAVSCWMTDFRSIRWANDLEHLAARIRDYRRVMDHWRGALAGVIHEVAYEDTVADVEGVARGLINACGLEWSEACLKFYQTRRSVRTASLTQVRQPIYTKSLERWRKYEEPLSALFALLPGSESVMVRDAS